MSFIYAGSSTSRSSIQVPFNQPLNLGPTASEVFPYPNMSQEGFNVIQSIAHLSYNSLQSKYEKRFGDGLAIKGAFTWSKDIDVGCADFWEGCAIQNEYDLKAERAVSAKSLPIVMSSSVLYKLPFGKGKNHLNTGVASKLAGGWQVNGIFLHNSGTAFNLAQTTDRANAFATNGSERYNVVGNTNGPHQRDNYFNAAAYAQPAQYTFGDGGRNDLRGPMYTDLDASLFRSFTVYRDVKFEFRSEFFNVLNHTNFGLPNTSCYAFTPSGTCDLNNPENSNFDKIRSTNSANPNPRQIQFAGKFSF